MSCLACFLFNPIHKKAFMFLKMSRGKKIVLKQQTSAENTKTKTGNLCFRYLFVAGVNNCSVSFKPPKTGTVCKIVLKE